MDVITMRVKEEVAYVFPGTLFSGPGPEELNWKTVGLRPAATVLQSFIEPPSQIVLPFFIQYRSPFKCTVRARNALPRFVPTPFPNIKSHATDSINVCGTPNFMVTEDARLKENANFVSAPRRHVPPEAIKYVFQLASEFWCNQRIAGRRIDAKILS